jgi:dolichol-phosphate mannosyltransferase
MKKPLISVVVPVYGSDLILPELVKQINDKGQSIEYDLEIVLIDDRGSDKTWALIKELKKTYPNIKGFKLSRNFGQHPAITAGFKKSNGQYVIVMDCDLQDNPKYIPELFNKSKEGFDIVCTLKKAKKYSKFRRITSNLFYYCSNWLTGVKLENNLGGYTMLNRQAVDSFLLLKDKHRHISILFAWLGYNRGFITVVHDDRFEGESSYSFNTLLKHAVDSIVSNSTKLLSLTIGLSFLFIFASMILIISIVIKSFYINFSIGWPSIVVLILLCTGFILLAIGIMGLYIGRIFEQTKDRPLFLIQDEV